MFLLAVTVAVGVYMVRPFEDLVTLYVTFVEGRAAPFLQNWYRKNVLMYTRFAFLD